jgi:hypothetical protein
MTGVPNRSVPDISVIVPVYNVQEHITACLHSLRAQTHERFEVIVIDDGSTDRSYDRARGAIGDDPRFRLIRQENRGLSGARNTGLEQARGTAIAFVDGDDRVMPHYLSALWQALDTSGADWVACAVRSCFDNGTSHVHSAIHGAPDIADHPALRAYCLTDWSDVICHFPSAWNKLYRRDLITGLRFQDGWFEDHLFYLAASLRTDQIWHLPQALYLQTRGRAGQITAQDDDRVFEQFDVLRDMRALMQGSERPGADQGFARIASRLLYERSTALKSPDRRVRFADESRHFLQEQSLIFTPEWDRDIARAWGLEMQGALPLTLILPWGYPGYDPALIRATLDSLHDQPGPGYELLLITPPGTDTTAMPPLPDTARLIPCPQAHLAWKTGLARAKGRFTICLSPGDVIRPVALQAAVEAMLRTDAPMGVMQFHMGQSPDAPPHHGFMDLRPAPNEVFSMTPETALALAPDLSNRIYKTRFLQEQSLFWPKTRNPGWAVGLNTALTMAQTSQRCAYVPWAGVGVARFDHPTPKAPLYAPLGRDFRRLMAALLPDLTSGLPPGWKRRLFARHLREFVDSHSPRNRGLRAVFFANLAVLSLKSGFSGARIDLAGFDHNCGPGLARLIHPLGALFRDPLLPNPNRDPGMIGTMMLFPVHKHGSKLAFAHFRVNFQEHDYANLNLRMKNGQHVPFHLSLRVKEQLAVCNDTHPDGRWRAERMRLCPLKRDGHDLRLEITKDVTGERVQVWLDGKQIFDLKRRRPWRRHGLRHLSRVTHLELQGGVTPVDLIPQVPGPGLMLDPRLMLRAGQPVKAPLLSGDMPLPVTSAPLGPDKTGQSRPGLSAMPTGRIWQGGREAITFTLPDGSNVALTRQIMADHITGMLDLGLDRGDPALAALVLEHLALGDLLELMPKPAQAAAHGLARDMRLSGLLPDPLPDVGPDIGPDASSGSKPLPATDPDTAQIHAAVAEFTQSQHSTPHADPAKVLAGLSLPKSAQKGLYLALCDSFCRAPLRFETLFDAARATGHHKMLPDLAHGEGWTLSAMLPFLLMTRQDRILRASFARLAQEDCPGWVQSAPLAWTLRRAQTHPGLPDKLREELIYLWFDFIAKQSWDYWGRAHCHDMTALAVWLLRHLERDDYMRRDLVAFCLRHYGLSRLFWSLLEEEGLLTHDLLTAQAHFHALRMGGPDQERALQFFEARKTPDAPRLRIELQGPAACPLPVGKALDTPHLHDPASDQPRALHALRHMAFPGSAPVTPALRAQVAEGLAEFYPNVPRAKRLAAQARAATLMQEALPDPGQLLMPLLDQLELISGDEDGFLGIGLALDLLHMRLTQGAPLGPLPDWISTRIRALPALARPRLRRAAVLVAPLARLAALPHPLAQDLAQKLRAPKAPTNLSGLPPAHPLFDTIVTVFSCRPHLDSRIPALRDSWLADLRAMGIPYVVMVGGGDGRRDGDVVHLNAPDDYEGLPQKTLSALAWVATQTPYAHMLKIDDDCFLNARAFFDNLSYRKHHYYGRKLTRTPGQMDRAWHQGKSTSPRGRHELDKSPEPASYADGGSGYVLSRHAICAALDQAQSPAGQRLIATSFMEDKLLGDLLAQAGIHVSEEDYRIAIRRRTHDTATPVSAWLNSFLPSQAAPVLLAHMDSADDMARAQAHLPAADLAPRKIWPSFQPARLGYQSNALDLLSPQHTVDRAQEAPVAVVACMRNEMFMLPQFLRHYRRLGVDSFLIADNASDDGTREYLLEQPDVALFSVDTDYNRSQYGVAWQQAMLSAFRLGKWSLVADADELLVWQQNQSQTLPDLLQSPDFHGAEAVRIFMLDMYPQGPLSDADFRSDPFEQAGFADREPFLRHTPMRGPFGNAPAWTSALRHRLIPGSSPNLFVAQKLALLRYHPFMRLSAGLHFVGDARLAPRDLIFGHFKYNADFRRKALAEVARGQHWGNAEEYRKYLALVSEGREQIYDPARALPWHDIPFVRDRLDPQPPTWDIQPRSAQPRSNIA